MTWLRSSGSAATSVRLGGLAPQRGTVGLPGTLQQASSSRTHRPFQRPPPRTLARRLGGKPQRAPRHLRAPTRRWYENVVRDFDPAGVAAHSG